MISLENKNSKLTNKTQKKLNWKQRLSLWWGSLASVGDRCLVVVRRWGATVLARGMEEWRLLVSGFGIGGGRGWGVGFWVLAAGEWGEVLGFAAAGGCWVPRRWVLILWFLAAGEWWVLHGSFFFFGTRKHNWMATFLEQVEKMTETTLWWREHDGEGFFFFFFLWWFFLVLDWLQDASDQTDRCLLWY